MPNPIPIQDLQREVSKIMRTMPARLGAEVVRFSHDRWRQQGWLGNTFQPWAPRRKGAKRNKGRAILMDKGRLRRSVRVVRVTADSVVIGSDVPYARVHNEGFAGRVNIPAHTRNKYAKEKRGTGIFSTKTRKERERTVTTLSGSTTVKAHTRYIKMPRRQFLGESQYLRRNLQRIIAAELMRAVKRTKNG